MTSLEEVQADEKVPSEVVPLTKSRSPDYLGMAIELNVGGQLYTTCLATLVNVSDSLLSQMFSEEGRSKLTQDSRGRYFIDRDGYLFRFVLDYLRNLRLVLPENFNERKRLHQEAEYFQLPGLIKTLNHRARGSSSRNMLNGTTREASEIENELHISNKEDTIDESFGGPGYITIGYRGTFAFGRDGLADVKFRKLHRILVNGKVNICREVFKDTLNESRDPDRGSSERYTARFFLKHTFLEQAFDMLSAAGFTMEGSCASSASALPNATCSQGQSGVDSDETRWSHYNEFVFRRD